MNRTLPVLGAGVLLGIIATLAVNQARQSVAPPAAEVVRDIAGIPPMTETVAEKHRGEQYASLDSVKDVLALPTTFARSEALHVLAGRTDAAGVGNLVGEANRIADDVEREALLSVLFSRLAELDPQSALELARTDKFADLPSLEDAVWRAWSRNDLDDALFAAKTQTRFAQQRRAARSLFAAFGYLGNATTDRIADELGIEPGPATRARYLYRLADRSPAEAISYINGLEQDHERQESTAWLAQYLSLGDPGEALRYADLFEDGSDGNRFTAALEGYVALAEPTTAIENMLAGGVDGRMWGQISRAVMELAATDLDAVMQYFEQARLEQHRQLLGAAIVAELANNDPAEALAWARRNDRGRFPALEMAALEQIARSDPQLALKEARASSNERVRLMMADSVVRQAAMHDPAAAIAILDQIEDKQQRLQASEGLVGAWIQQDPDAAVEWILGQDKETSGQLMMQVINQMAFTDVDAAIRLLPKLGDMQQTYARQHIAEILSNTRSIEAAQAFILQFQGQPDYDRLQATVAVQLAQSDTLMARQLADQIQDSAARDSAHMQILLQQAESNPVEARDWLKNISDDAMRSQAVSQVAAQWYRQDPAAATQWVSNMPRGSDRDDAILQLAGWGEPTAQRTALIATIEDKDKRSQAKVRQIYALMQTDPAQAMTMLEDGDFSDEQRADMRINITRIRSRY